MASDAEEVMRRWYRRPPPPPGTNPGSARGALGDRQLVHHGVHALHALGDAGRTLSGHIALDRAVQRDDSVAGVHVDADGAQFGILGKTCLDLGADAGIVHDLRRARGRLAGRLAGLRGGGLHAALRIRGGFTRALDGGVDLLADGLPVVAVAGRQTESEGGGGQDGDDARAAGRAGGRSVGVRHGDFLGASEI